MLKKITALVLALSVSLVFAAVEVNTATSAELDSIKGIGPATSNQILAERQKGKFKDWNDLIARVKGIQKTKAANFSQQGLVVGGASLKGAEPTEVKPVTKKGSSSNAQ